MGGDNSVWVWYNRLDSLVVRTEEGGKIMENIMWLASMVTKAALVVIAGGLIWTMGGRLLAKYRKRPKD